MIQAAIKHDGQVDIAVGKSRRSTSWQNRELLWSELAARLDMPTRTPETYGEYSEMPKAQRDEVKDVGGFVGGKLRNGRRKADSVINRRLLTLDIDSVPTGTDPWPTVKMVFGCAALLYSTHSHTPKNPRLRLVVPLSREVSPEEYGALSRRVAGDIGIDMCDDTTYEAHRLMYWPSVSIDAEYRYELSDGPWLDVDEQLRRYVDWRDTTQWPVSSRKSRVMQRLAKKQGDPAEKPGLVGAFCRVYPAEEAIALFLADVYEPSAIEGRYDYIPADSSAGVVVYEDGKFVYSHHASDPASGRLCNSFDLVRLHLFGDQDDAAAPGTPTSRLPSYLAMSELAADDPKVRQDLTAHKLAELGTAFDDDDSENNDWLQQLAVSAKGKIASTIDNALIVLLNDPELKGKYYFDEFRARPIVCGDLPWQELERRVSAGWVDSDDSGLRNFLEKKYDLDNAIKVRDAVELAMLRNQRHPIREYLLSLIWDGEPRADTLFIDYLDATDNEYTRAVTGKALIGAVARVMRPGCKHDHVLTLVGPQGCGKSTTLATLGKDWFSDSLYTMAGKDAYEQLQGYWIIEMAEMAAARKAELEQIKQFISKQVDSYRAAYARRTQEHPRQCAFFGSTNDDEFLKDPTGSRRFWPVQVTAKGRERAEWLSGETVDQIWAEALVRYNAGEPWHLDQKTEQLAWKVQAAHTERSDKYGLIEKYLDILLPERWPDMPLDERMMFLHDNFGETGTALRTRVCALEIWQELFKGDPRNYSQTQAREINGIMRRMPGWTSNPSCDCGKIYGRQRAFMRTDAAPAGS